MKKKKEKSMYQAEMERDIQTFHRLHGKEKLQFIYDYYKWYILAAIVILFAIVTFAHNFWEAQKPYRLRTCVVLNTDADCSSWFDSFEKTLKSDGKSGDFELTIDQHFDNNNNYVHVRETTVQSTISAGRMDVAVCGPDMYHYLLMTGACMPLDQAFSEEDLNSLKTEDMLVYATANVIENDDGTTDDSNAEEGYYAVDISNTAFGKTYNNREETDLALYAVIISNTTHLDDSVTQVKALCAK
jgi:hypothetical protein